MVTVTWCGQICEKAGHPALKCRHRFNNSYQSEDLPKALAALRITDVTENSSQDWYADSGASALVTNSTAHLQQAQPYKGNDSVMIGDSSFLPISPSLTQALPP